MSVRRITGKERGREMMRIRLIDDEVERLERGTLTAAPTPANPKKGAYGGHRSVDIVFGNRVVGRI